MNAKQENSPSVSTTVNNTINTQQGVIMETNANTVVIGEEVWGVKKSESGTYEFTSTLESVPTLNEAMRIVQARKELRDGNAELLWLSEMRVMKADLQGDIIKLEFYEVELETDLGTVEGFGISSSDREPMEFVGTFDGVIKYVEEVIGGVRI